MPCPPRATGAQTAVVTNMSIALASASSSSLLIAQGYVEFHESVGPGAMLRQDRVFEHGMILQPHCKSSDILQTHGRSSQMHYSTARIKLNTAQCEPCRDDLLQSCQELRPGERTLFKQPIGKVHFDRQSLQCLFR